MSDRERMDINTKPDDYLVIKVVGGLILIIVIVSLLFFFWPFTN